VLLTGATGFVGVHLLHALISESTARVTCLVRAEDQPRAYERLHAALAQQGLRIPDLGVRVRVMAADLTQPRFGLSERVYQQLAEGCDSLFHCAATVSLTRGYASLRADNVLATRAIIELAACGAPKALHHVSTVAVGRGEETFVAAHEGLRDGYTQSKWAAERLIEQARAWGVDATVYRLGRVVGSPASGYVNAADIVWRIVRAGVPRGALPELDVCEPWTPVDFVARVLVELARATKRAPLYNLAPEPQVALRDVFAWIREFGYTLELLPVPAWLARLRDATDEETVATRAFFELRARESHSAFAPLRCDELARALPDLKAPPIDRDVVHRYLAYAVSRGLLPTASGGHSAD
jgi:nonribosomal peptide synthetase MxcG